MKKRDWFLPLFCALCLVATAVLYALGVPVEEKQDLQRRIMGVWQRQPDTEAGEDVLLELHIGKDRLEYRFVSPKFPDLNKTLVTYHWEPVNGGLLRLVDAEGKTLPVAVSQKDGRMFLSPGITQQSSYEEWERKE